MVGYIIIDCLLGLVTLFAFSISVISIYFAERLNQIMWSIGILFLSAGLGWFTVCMHTLMFNQK